MADALGPCIQVFTAEGQFLSEMNFPTSVSMDFYSIVYVTEHNNHRVWTFTTEGQYLEQREWGQEIQLPLE